MALYFQKTYCVAGSSGVGASLLALGADYFVESFFLRDFVWRVVIAVDRKNLRRYHSFDHLDDAMTTTTTMTMTTTTTSRMPTHYYAAKDRKNADKDHNLKDASLDDANKDHKIADKDHKNANDRHQVTNTT